MKVADECTESTVKYVYRPRSIIMLSTHYTVIILCIKYSHVCKFKPMTGMAVEGPACVT